MKVYISGQISGIPIEEVRANFAKAESAISDAGLTPVNPLNNGLTVNDDWIDHIREDIKILSECDAIYFLNGWRNSAGAKIEFMVAKKLGLVELYIDPPKEGHITFSLPPYDLYIL